MERAGERQRQRDWLIELYFSTVKILAQRLTHISAIATVLLVTKTFTHTYTQTDRQTDRETHTHTDGQTDRDRESKGERDGDRETERKRYDRQTQREWPRQSKTKRDSIEREAELERERENWPEGVPSVWSALGPVFTDPVVPLLTNQSKLSLLLWVQLQVLASSKLQSAKPKQLVPDM